MLTVHQDGAAFKKGALTTVARDAPGASHPLLLTDGQAGDALAGHELLARLAPGGILLADKAYDTDTIRTETAELGGFANVPPRTIRTQMLAFSV